MNNRVIKFRAWDEQKHIMHYDFEFIRSGTESSDWIVFKSDKQPLTDEQHPFENPYFQQQLKIMQYTGLTDKNNKEIYEGDICKSEHFMFTGYSSDGGDIFEDFTAPVTFDDAAWFIGHIPCMSIKDESIEVIGNIYENPDLLPK